MSCELRTMTSFKENRNSILASYDDGDLTDEEFVLLYDMNRSTNLDIPYLDYERFDLDKMNDDECKAEFRFMKNDVYTLFDVLNFPGEIRCSTGFKVPGICALCVLLKRFSYPCRYLDMIPRFGMSSPQLCMVAQKSLNFFYENWGHLLRTFDQE